MQPNPLVLLEAAESRAARCVRCCSRPVQRVSRMLAREVVVTEPRAATRTSRYAVDVTAIPPGAPAAKLGEKANRQDPPRTSLICTQLNNRNLHSTGGIGGARRKAGISPAAATSADGPPAAVEARAAATAKKANKLETRLVRGFGRATDLGGAGTAARGAGADAARIAASCLRLRAASSSGSPAAEKSLGAPAGSALAASVSRREAELGVRPVGDRAAKGSLEPILGRSVAGTLKRRETLGASALERPRQRLSAAVQRA
eukprot:scaffold7039_cov118-Isochrysis_galbana.AAC.5